MPELLSVVLPVYNQADHIAAVVDEYEEALIHLPHPHELLLVVNGSRDASLAVCQQLATKYPSVRALESPHAGWGRAVKFGLAAAQGTLICYTNSARTHASDLVLLLLYAVANPGVVIKANRKIRDNWMRRLGSLLYNRPARNEVMISRTARMLASGLTSARAERGRIIWWTRRSRLRPTIPAG